MNCPNLVSGANDCTCTENSKKRRRPSNVSQNSPQRKRISVVQPMAQHDAGIADENYSQQSPRRKYPKEKNESIGVCSCLPLATSSSPSNSSTPSPSGPTNDEEDDTIIKSSSTDSSNSRSGDSNNSNDPSHSSTSSISSDPTNDEYNILSLSSILSAHMPEEEAADAMAKEISSLLPSNGFDTNLPPSATNLGLPEGDISSDMARAIAIAWFIELNKSKYYEGCEYCYVIERCKESQNLETAPQVPRLVDIFNVDVVRKRSEWGKIAKQIGIKRKKIIDSIKSKEKRTKEEEDMLNNWNLGRTSRRFYSPTVRKIMESIEQKKKDERTFEEKEMLALYYMYDSKRSSIVGIEEVEGEEINSAKDDFALGCEELLAGDDFEVGCEELLLDSENDFEVGREEPLLGSEDFGLGFELLLLDSGDGCEVGCEEPLVGLFDNDFDLGLEQLLDFGDDSELGLRVDGEEETELHTAAAAVAGLPANVDASQKSYTVAVEFEVKSDKELMDMLSEANRPGNWNQKKHSKLATLLAKRAVIAAAKDGDIQKLSETSEGVTKAQVLEWVNGPETFKGYQQMMGARWSNIDARMGTALKDAGYKRISGGGGRSGVSVRYALPEDIVPRPTYGQNNCLSVGKKRTSSVGILTEAAEFARKLRDAGKGWDEIYALMETKLSKTHVSAYRPLQIQSEVDEFVSKMREEGKGMDEIFAQMEKKFPKKQINLHRSSGGMRTKAATEFVSKMREEGKGWDEIYARVEKKYPKRQVNLQKAAAGKKGAKMAADTRNKMLSDAQQLENMFIQANLLQYRDNTGCRLLLEPLLSETHVNILLGRRYLYNRPNHPPAEKTLVDIGEEIGAKIGEAVGLIASKRAHVTDEVGKSFGKKFGTDVGAAVGAQVEAEVKAKAFDGALAQIVSKVQTAVLAEVEQKVITAIRVAQEFQDLNKP